MENFNKLRCSRLFSSTTACCFSVDTQMTAVIRFEIVKFEISADWNEVVDWFFDVFFLSLEISFSLYF